MSIGVTTPKSKEHETIAKLIVLLGEFESHGDLRTAVHADDRLSQEEKQFALSLPYAEADFESNV